MIRRFNHAAFRCLDAEKTIDFYTKGLGLTFSQAFQNDYVPSMGMNCPHIHLFFELADGSGIAFFEAPSLPLPRVDPGTPPWIQHIAFDVADDNALEEGMKRLHDYGWPTGEIIDHKVGHSLYFSDPSGHRLELCYWLDSTKEAHDRLQSQAKPTVERWLARKQEEFSSDKEHA